jgi:choline-sulfatase
MYDLTADATEFHNLYGIEEFELQQGQLAELLAQQREQKRLSPVSGEVPGGRFVFAPQP